MRTPSEDVLRAFGASDELMLLDGGRGRTWRAGAVVLKPVDLAVESRWRASVIDALDVGDRLRVARPVRASSGDWLHDGWEAWHHVAGVNGPERWDAAVEAGAAFHEALAGVARPDFLDARDDWWSRADRASWDDPAFEGPPVLRRLLEVRGPVKAESQLVHGDLLGNVLYEPGLPPAVIDWPPYWRPASWAAAVAVVDALCWHGAGPQLAERWSGLDDWPQMLVRALLFRMLTDAEAARAHGGRWDVHPAYVPAADLVVGLAGS